MTATLTPEQIVVVLKETNNKLRQELADRKARQMGTYRLARGDLLDLSKVHWEISRGDQDYGLRLLEKLLDDHEPNWRAM